MTVPLPRNVILSGQEADAPSAAPLRAGPVEVRFVAGDLRYFRCDGHEVLRRVYAAVRDRNWGTVPAVLSEVKIDAKKDRFRITYTADHREGPIHFRWQAAIEGAPEGTITFSMDGKALTTFARNRIGLCVHHPLEGFAGRPCSIETTGGQVVEGTAPAEVTPHQPFRNLWAVTHEAAPGLRSEVRFEGEVFEMEDHRNWTDASFKTYGTPLDLPFPVEVPAGSVVRQRVTFRLLRRAARLAPAARPKAVPLTLGKEEVPLPRIGLAARRASWNPAPEQLDRLRRLHLSHLRVDADALTGEGPVELQLGIPLEVVLLAGAEVERQLQSAADFVRERKLEAARWIVLDSGSPVTTEATARRARRIVGPGVLIGGTRGNFAELNRNRPPAGRFDGLAFTANPQVHAFDNLTLAENGAAFGDVIRTARSFAGGAPVFVSPVTLRVQFNPAATGAAAPVASGALPPEVDPRQMSLLGAGYTAAAFKHLAEAGAAGVTFYETAGWKGVMESAEGSPQPARFRSIAGSVFPVWHLLADLGEFRDGRVIPSVSGEPLAVEAVALRSGGFTRLIVVNLSAEVQTVAIPSVLAGAASRLRVLDAASAVAAMTEPERQRAPLARAALRNPAPMTLRLDAFALATLDCVTEKGG
jgi:hypothetical protein